jgi:hypothetical protein
MIRSLACALSIALGLGWAGVAAARPIPYKECAEGGEFIRNAALARDMGITREFFIAKLEEDLVLIRAFPPELRWFAQDDEDELFLSERAAQVFDAPRKPHEHEAAFVRECLLQSAKFDREM